MIPSYPIRLGRRAWLNHNAFVKAIFQRQAHSQTQLPIADPFFVDISHHQGVVIISPAVSDHCIDTARVPLFYMSVKDPSLGLKAEQAIDYCLEWMVARSGYVLTELYPWVPSWVCDPKQFFDHHVTHCPICKQKREKFCEFGVKEDRHNYCDCGEFYALHPRHFLYRNLVVLCSGRVVEL